MHETAERLIRVTRADLAPVDMHLSGERPSPAGEATLVRALLRDRIGVIFDELLDRAEPATWTYPLRELLDRLIDRLWLMISIENPTLGGLGHLSADEHRAEHRELLERIIELRADLERRVTVDLAWRQRLRFGARCLADHFEYADA